MFVAENYGDVIDQIIAEHYPENVLSKAPKTIMQTSTTSSTKAISPTTSRKMMGTKGGADNGSIGRESRDTDSSHRSTTGSSTSTVIEVNNVSTASVTAGGDGSKRQQHNPSSYGRAQSQQTPHQQTCKHKHIQAKI